MEESRGVSGFGLPTQHRASNAVDQGDEKRWIMQASDGSVRVSISVPNKNSFIFLSRGNKRV